MDGLNQEIDGLRQKKKNQKDCIKKWNKRQHDKMDNQGTNIRCSQPFIRIYKKSRCVPKSPSEWLVKIDRLPLPRDTFPVATTKILSRYVSARSPFCTVVYE